VNRDKIQYIINYYTQFFTDHESKAHRHLMSLEKLGEVNEDDNRLTAYKKMEWISSDPIVLDLIKNGAEEFYKKTANRIVNDNGEIELFNNCPNCGKLARTPKAKQCRFCENKWF